LAKLSPGETVLDLGSGGSGGSRHIQIGAKIILVVSEGKHIQGKHVSPNSSSLA
jgi:cyclopropane fatty-acyl-phospholipid synthase-like methyltransferase